MIAWAGDPRVRRDRMNRGAEQNRTESTCRRTESALCSGHQTEGTFKSEALYLGGTQALRQHLSFHSSPGENCDTEICLNQSLNHLIVIEFQTMSETDSYFRKFTLDE